MFQVQGILKVKNNEVQVSDRFKKREFVLTTEANSQYPQHVQFQLVQDKCSLINDFNVGEELKVSFNLRGREWAKDSEVRYFNTLDAWRIERVGNSTPVSNQSSNTTQNNNTMDNNNSTVFSGNTGGGNDDLPF
ncbi:MAG: DUF3127 domain-containing protein [Bacteroidia bacterium]|nr:DUF3127 domain-containing protein [Bacteroidia bacterium]